MKAKIIIAIILFFLFCIASEFAVNGLADFPYLEKLFGQKKKVVEENNHFYRPKPSYRLGPSQLYITTSMPAIGFDAWDKNRKEVDDR